MGSCISNRNPIARVPDLTTIQLPIPWASFGFPDALQLGTTCLIDGSPGWHWDPTSPELDIPRVARARGQSVPNWGLDHVVVLVPALDEATRLLHPLLGGPRLRLAVQGRPTAFYRAGPLLEVIESPVRSPALYGVALSTSESLETVALNWRSRGLDVGDPIPAQQPGRRIFTVRGTSAGLAVMSADGSV